MKNRRSEDKAQAQALLPPFLSNFLPGVTPGSTALDTISQNLATMKPSQSPEVLAQMKVRTKQTPRLLRYLLDHTEIRLPVLRYFLLIAC